MADQFFGITDTGRLRDNNEDTFIAQKILNNRYIIACVIDGVGGYEGGEVASAIAREAILSYFSVLSGDFTTMLKEALVVANEKIYSEKMQGNGNPDMACVATLSVIDLDNNNFYYAHVGDTRLYLFRDNSLVKVTKDHSFVGFLEDSGRLTEEQAMTHLKRNEINKALGFSPQIGIHTDYIETGSSPFLPGDILLLCSDGLSDMINSQEITAILTHHSQLKAAGEALIDAANRAGGKDNITVVLVRNNARPVKQKATKPATLKKKPQKEKEPSLSEETEKVMPEVVPVKGKKKRSLLVPVLSALCVVFLAGFLWLLLRNEKENAPQQPPAPVVKESTAEEMLLSDMLNRTAGSKLQLPDSLFRQPIVLTDTVVLNRDSLHIQGEGQIIIRGDSSFAGPAFMLPPNCRYILLENLTLQHFDLAILSQGRALRLENVRFQDCKVPVQYQISFPNGKYVSGKAENVATFKTDTIPN